MKKNNAIIGVIVIIIIVIGVVALTHKSTKTPPASTAQTSGQSSAPAINNAVLTTKTDSKLGQYLADPTGKALYTYGADTSGVSNCTGSCLSAWPAYQDKSSTANLPAGVSTITRSDNSEVQYTYNGMPLYYFASDSTGQVTGNGVSNFSVAKPAAAASSSGSSSSTQSTTPSQSSSSSSNPYNY